MQEEEKDFQRRCVEQLKEDLVSLLRNRSYELQAMEEKRAQLQEVVRKLNMDVCAVDLLLASLLPRG